MPNMASIRTPEKYSPEFCASVISNMQASIQSAIDALTTVTSGQKELTLQSIKHIEDAFSDIKANIKELQSNQGFDEDIFERKIKPIADKIDKIEIFVTDTEKNMNRFKVKFYASGITALVFLIGFTFTIFKMLQTTLQQIGT